MEDKRSKQTVWLPSMKEKTTFEDVFATIADLEREVEKCGKLLNELHDIIRKW